MSSPKHAEKANPEVDLVHHEGQGTPVSDENATTTGMSAGAMNETLESSENKGRLPSFRLILAIFSLAAVYNAALAAFVSIAPLISVINEDIGPESSYSWMATGYTISAGISLAICGSVSDLVGRRWVAVGSGLLGVVGSIVGATAKGVPVVIVSMILIGIAGGGCQNSLAAICELVPTHARGKVLGTVNSITSMWAVFGSLYAFHMNEKYGWPSVFWVSVALHALGGVLCFLFYHPSDPLALGGKSRMQILQEFDWVGLGGLMAGPTCVLLGISWLGAGYDSKDAHFIAPLIVGVAACVALGVYEAYIPKNPILHPNLFKRFRSFTIVLVLVFVGGMLFYSLQSLFPSYVQLIFTGPDPTKIGLWGICLGAGTTVGGISSGFLITIIRNTRLMLIFGVSVMAIFIALMAVPKPGDNSMALAFTFFGGVGIGWEQTLGILVVQLACPDEWIGFATGILGLFRICGGAAGTAIYTTVLSTQARKNLPSIVAEAVLASGLPQSSLQSFMGTFLGKDPSAAAALPGVTPAILGAAAEAVKYAYYRSFRIVWLVTIPFGVAGVTAALFSRDQSHNLVKTTAITLKAEEQNRDTKKDVDPEK